MNLKSLFRWNPKSKPIINQLPRFLRSTAVLIREFFLISKPAAKISLRTLASNTAGEETLKNLVLGVDYLYCSGVEGEIAEFGTMTGATSKTILRALGNMTYLNPTPIRLHLFDSFQGLPAATSSVDKESPHVISGVWGKGTCKDLSKDQLIRECSKILPKERFVVYEGWFNETLPTISKEVKFGMIHLDCDLYQSILDVLDYCFFNNIVSEGAVLFFDDWNCNKSGPQYGARKAWQDMVEKYSISFSDGGDYSWGCHKFIVHSYANPQ